MELKPDTKLFCGSVREGLKFVCTVNAVYGGWDAEIIVMERLTGEIVDSFTDYFAGHMRPSGIWRLMKDKAYRRNRR